MDTSFRLYSLGKGRVERKIVSFYVREGSWGGSSELMKTQRKKEGIERYHVISRYVT